MIIHSLHRTINGHDYFSNTLFVLFWKIKWNSKAIKCIKANMKNDNVDISYKNKILQRI